MGTRKVCREIKIISKDNNNKNTHCVKIVRICSCFGPYFPTFGLNTDQKNSKNGHFSYSDEQQQHKNNNKLVTIRPPLKITITWNMVTDECENWRSVGIEVNSLKMELKALTIGLVAFRIADRI